MSAEETTSPWVPKEESCQSAVYLLISPLLHIYLTRI